jgi:hypothetical protein
MPPPFPLGGMPSPSLPRACLVPLALLLAAAPASALKVPDSPAHLLGNSANVGSVGVGAVELRYEFAPSQASAAACIEHDPDWRIGPGVDEDGNDAVWVPLSPDESDGSEKATTECVSSPPDGGDKVPDAPAAPALPVIVAPQGFS